MPTAINISLACVPPSKPAFYKDSRSSNCFAGVSGERVVPTMTHRMRHHLEREAQAGKRYDYITLLGGINDIGSGILPAEIFKGLTAMYHAAAAHGASLVAMTTMETKFADPGTPQDEPRHKLNELIRAFIKEHGGTFGSHNVPGASVPQAPGANGGTNATHPTTSQMPDHGVSPARPTLLFLDLERRLPYHALTQGEKDELWDDGLHLTAKGYDVMGSLIFEALQPHIRGRLE